MQNDVHTEEERELLLSTAVASCSRLSSFTSEDVEFMAKHLTFVAFDVDELIMQRGEASSWVGLLLSGVLVTSIDGHHIGELTAGDCVGEVAFFLGGSRQSDMHGAESGYLATMMIPALEDFLAAAPLTAYKLIRLFGASGIHHITAGPSLHQPLHFDLSHQQVVEELQEAKFLATLEEHAGIAEDDGDYLMSNMHFHRFVPGELLLDTFANNECVCFVVSGEIDFLEPWTGNKHPMGFEIPESKVLQDVAFFDQSAGKMPCHVIGREEGLVGGLPHNAIESVARERPQLAMQLMRMIGFSAIDACFEVATRTPPELGPKGSNERRVTQRKESETRWQQSRTAWAEAAEPGKLEVFYRNTASRQNEADEEAQAHVAKKKAEAEAAKAKRDAEMDANKYRQQLQKLQGQVRAAKDQLSTAKTENTRMKTSIKGLEKELRKTKEELSRKPAMSKRKSGGMKLQKAVQEAGEAYGAPASTPNDDDARSVISNEGSVAASERLSLRSGISGSTMGAESRRKSRENPLTQIHSLHSISNPASAPGMGGAIAGLEDTLRLELRAAQAQVKDMTKSNEKLQKALNSSQEEQKTMEMKLRQASIDATRFRAEANELRTTGREEMEKDRQQMRDALSYERDAHRDTYEEGNKRSDALRRELSKAHAECQVWLGIMSDEIASAEDRNKKDERTMELQRFAAKGLGLAYVSQLYPLQREIKRLREKCDLDRETLLALPFKQKMLEKRCAKAETALAETHTQLEIAAKRVANAEEVAMRATAELTTKRSELNTATQRTDQLESWTAHLVGELSRAGVQVRALGKRLAKSQKHEASAERELSAWASRAHFATGEVAKMASRVVHLEDTFRPLLPPDMPMTKANASGAASPRGSPYPMRPIMPLSQGAGGAPMAPFAAGSPHRLTASRQSIRPSTSTPNLYSSRPATVKSSASRFSGVPKMSGYQQQPAPEQSTMPPTPTPTRPSSRDGWTPNRTSRPSRRESREQVRLEAHKPTHEPPPAVNDVPALAIQPHYSDGAVTDVDEIGSKYKLDPTKSVTAGSLVDYGSLMPVAPLRPNTPESDAASMAPPPPPSDPLVVVVPTRKTANTVLAAKPGQQALFTPWSREISRPITPGMMGAPAMAPAAR